MKCENCNTEIGNNKKCPICGHVNKDVSISEGTVSNGKRKDSFWNRNINALPKIIVVFLLLMTVSIYVFNRNANRGAASEDNSASGTSASETSSEGNSGDETATSLTDGRKTETEVEKPEETAYAESDFIVNQDAVDKLVTINANIPRNADVFQGHSYYIYDDGCETWNDAKENCESRGGYLAVINSKEENDYLFDYMITENKDEVFFGFTDQGHEGTWTWIPGKESNFTDWGVNSEGSQEPNADSEYENYAHMNSAMHDGHWNDKRFGKVTSWYFCEWDLINYQGKDCNGTSKKDLVPVKNNADESADIIVNLKQNETVRVLFQITKDDGKKWYYIQHKSGVIGYVNSNLLSIN